MSLLNKYVVCLSYGKVKGKAKKYPYWQPALYKIYHTKDGRKVWKYLSHLGVARRSERLAIQDGLELCGIYGYRWSDNKIRNWYEVKNDL